MSFARPFFLAAMAEIYGKMEQPEDGIRALAEAFALVAGNGERQYEAELYRLYGELSLRAGERTKGEGRRGKSPPRPASQSPLRLQGVFTSVRDCPSATSKIPRTARGDEPGAALADAGQRR